jgi:hypothetical protein
MAKIIQIEATCCSHRQTAMSCLLAAAERRVPPMMARIAMVKALANGQPPEGAATRRKALGSSNENCLGLHQHREVGDVDHLKVFASEDADRKWLEEGSLRGSPSRMIEQ